MRHLECKQGHWVVIQSAIDPISQGTNFHHFTFSYWQLGWPEDTQGQRYGTFICQFTATKISSPKGFQEPDKAARCENQLVQVQPYKIEDTSTARMSTGTKTISAGSFSPMLLHSNQKLPTNKNGHTAKTWAACCRFS